MIAATVVPHFQPKNIRQYALMMGILAGLSLLCVVGIFWMKARFMKPIPPVLQKASALLEERNYDQAAALILPVIGEIERAQGPESPGLVRHLDLLAAVYAAMGKQGEAEALLRRSYLIRRKNLGPEHPESIASGDKLATSLVAQGKFPEAEALLRKSLAHREAYYGTDHEALLPTLNRLAELFLVQKRYSDAESFARRAVRIGRGTIGLLPPAYADSMRDLGAVLAGLEKYSDAVPLYGEAVRRKSALLPDQPHIPPKAGQISHGDFADLCKEYAAVLRKAGKETEARDIEARAEAVLHPKQ